jgi:Ca2+-binding RTX toxin-like protein
VAPITAAGLVLSSDVGSVSGTVDALSRAAALRVFSAQSVVSRVGPATELGNAGESGPRSLEASPVAVRSVAAAGGPSNAVSRVAAPTPVSAAIGSAVRADITASAGPVDGRGSSGVNAAPAWSAVLLDASSAIGQVPSLMTSALWPEMPATGGGDVLIGGTGEDLLVGGAGRNLLVGGYAASRSATSDVAIDGLRWDGPYASLAALLVDGWAAGIDQNSDAMFGDGAAGETAGQ